MLLIARRNLFSERIRLSIAIGGVALSVFLIMFLLSLYRGWSDKVGAFVEEVDVDIWIAREGTADFLSSASFLPTGGVDENFAVLPSIERWSPLVVRPMSAKKGETEMDVTLVGYDPDLGIGGPLRIEAGDPAPGPGEVIIDKVLTDRYGVQIGDMIRAAGKDWRVVGQASGGDFVAAQIIFVRLEEAQEALSMEGFATYFVLQMVPTADLDEFVTYFEGVQPGITAITREDFAEATRNRILDDVVPVLLAIVVLAFIVGLAVAGLTIYTATVEKLREYGILKAVGFKNTYLYRLVMEQSLVTGLLGFLAGMVLTLALSPVARDLVPQFVVLIRWQDIAVVGASTVLMSVIAGYVPVRRLATIDPTSVFRA